MEPPAGDAQRPHPGRAALSPRTLVWHDAITGKETGTATIKAAGPFSLVGLSQDGSRAVLVNVSKQESTFAVVSQSGEQTLTLPANQWGFDALSGNKLLPPEEPVEQRLRDPAL